MRTRSCPVVLLALAALTGCGSGSGLPTTNDLLAGAHQSLVAGDLKTTGQWLGSARARLQTKEQLREFQLLTAELDIRSGDAGLAAASMDELLSRDPDDPRAHELAGKAHLLLGDFSEARRHFGIAAGRYRSEEDSLRAADLLTLARGFEAYATGSVTAAHEHWKTIRSRGLRASVFDASAAVAPTDAPGDGVLASSHQPAP